MKVFSTFPLTFFTSVSFDQTLRTHFTVYVSFYLSFNILKQKLTWYTVYDKIELWTVSKRLQNKICIEKTLWYIRFCHWTFLLWEIVVLVIFAVGDCATGLFCCGRFWCWTFLLWEILMLDFLASGQMNRQAGKTCCSYS